MTPPANIHPFIRATWPGRRATLLARQAERLLAFELVNERTVEQHFDEAARLRLHRVIERQVLRGTLRERYAEVLLQVADGRAPRGEATHVLGTLLDADTAAAAARFGGAPAPAALADYEALLPREAWPVVLCMAHGASAVDALQRELEALALEVRRTPLARFGILHVPVPPELTVVESLAMRPSVSCLADGGAPVGVPAPLDIGPEMTEVRAVLGLDAPAVPADQGLATIAVLDTGLDLAHPAFRRMSSDDYQNFTRWPGDDENGHGTHVAFIAAGGPVPGHAHTGVAPASRLIAGKVLHGRGLGSLEDILNGMAWAVFDRRADVLSISLGEDGTPPNGQSFWSRACDEAFHQGAIVCVSAGNPDPAVPETITVPADAQTAVAVGAIDKAGRLADFSAKGSYNPASPLYRKPNCVAPGVNVTAARSSASQTGAGLLVTYSGTSMAAPAVAGCLARLKSHARTLGWEINPAELLDIYYGACRPLQAENGEPYSQEFEVGHGLVDMPAAFRAIEARAGTRAAAAPARADAGHQTPVDPPAAASASGAPAAPPSAGAPTSAASSAASPVAGAPPPARAWDPKTCYCCGRAYPTRVGLFSDAQRCATCGAPICRVCWAAGERGCDTHRRHARVAPPQAAVPFAPPAIPVTGRRKGADAMTDSPPPCEIDADGLAAARAFRLGFEQRTAEHADLEVERGTFVKRQTPQEIRLRFGEMVRVVYAAGVWKLTQPRLAAVALSLNAHALVRHDGVCVPADDVFERIESPDGVDLTPDLYHAVGVFSPVGWPASRLRHLTATSRVEYHLVEYIEGRWHVHSARGSRYAYLFGQSGADEAARAAAALAADERLQHGGGQVALDKFVAHWNVSAASVAEAVEASGKRFKLVAGGTAIQRTFTR